MKFCLSCRQLSSDRDLSGPSLFCPHCGLAFGVRRCKKCKKKPSSPLDATFCVHCGTDSLSPATAYVNLGWISILLYLAAGYLLLHWIGPLFLNGLGFSFSLKSVYGLFMMTLDRVLFWLIMFGLWYMILSFVPGTEPLRKLMVDALRSTVKFVFHALGALLKWLSQMLLAMISKRKVGH
jgi:hypothetical protein